MEQNFQTSFIPKKPMVEQVSTSKRPIGFILIISIAIFLVTVLVSGGVYYYRDVLKKSRTQMEVDLNLAKNRFEPAQITKLKILDKRLQSSSEVLANHISVSPIFEALGALTLKTIRYTNFSYDFANSKVIVKMSGQAVGYRSVALQADMFSKNKNLIDPVFSNLSLDEKGNVLFDLQFSVDKTFVNYEQLLKANSNLSNTGTNPDTGIVN